MSIITSNREMETHAVLAPGGVDTGYWPHARWPEKVQSWPRLDLVGPTQMQINKYCRAKSWIWNSRRLYFLCDMHADADAFFLSLSGAGGIHKTGPSDADFELTAAGRTAKFIIGGDCLDKGPGNFRLLESIHQLYLKGADIELLAGNHDMRTFVGFYYAESKDPLTEHLFVRMGKKTVPLIKEIFDNYIASQVQGPIGENHSVDNTLYPDANWYQTFPLRVKTWLKPKAIEKELLKISEKTRTLRAGLQEIGLTTSQVYACVKKFRALFFEPTGRYYWFFEKMKLSHREGSYLFVHAGVDDAICAEILSAGVDDINRQFRTLLQSNPVKLYYSVLGNMFRTKYRDVDYDFTHQGAGCLHKAGIFAIVHGHRNGLQGQRLVIRNGMLNFECDASVDCNTRVLEGLKGPGGAAVIFTKEGHVSGLSTDYPYIKQFYPAPAGGG